MTLNFKVFGSGEPVIILHGLFGMLDNWQTFAKKLAEDYTVHIIDQRNHGKSPHSDEFNYKLLSADVNDFIGEHDIQSPHIIGHSMGGKTVMQYAADYPDTAKTITIIDMAPKAYEGSHTEIFDAVLSMDLASLEKRSDADDHLAQSIDQVAVRQFLLKNLSRSSDGFRWKANFSSLYKHYESILGNIEISKAIRIPASFIYSDRSGYLEQGDIEMISTHFTNATFTKMTAGHWIHAEKPIELMELVKEHLSNT
jgi:pimeloyl-ACP methyl ester carboxylesterase